MITRKLGAILRGKATPFQLVTACVLGSLLGFAPAPMLAPALYVLLVAALLVVNANLGLALFVAAGAKIVSLLAVPVSFQIGRFLLDGPTEGLARVVVNAPVLAWCGLHYYAVAGGMALGLVLGLLMGFTVTRSVASFRQRMVAAADDPGRLQALAAKPWARFMMWLFLGTKTKKTWDEKLDKRFGNPVRVWGAALLVLMVSGVYFANAALAGSLARGGLRSGLERVNGATVDVGAVEVELGEGRVAVSELAIADPGALAQDLFRAAHLELDVEQADLLRRRVHVARVVVSEAKSGAPRTTPGVLIVEPPEEPEETGEGEAGEDMSLEDVLVEYEVWKERLTQVRRVLDALSGPPSEEDGEEIPEEERETLGERLAREVAEKGWFGVEARHLVDEVPSFRLSELVVDGLEMSFLPGRVLDLKGSELSTQPWLLDAPATLSLASRDGTIGFAVDLGPVSRGRSDGYLRMHWKGLSVDETMAKLKLPGPAPLSGGTIDLELDGVWSGGRIGWIDMPLRATLRNTTLTVEGVPPTEIAELVLPIGLRGPIDSPRVRFDSSALTDALVAAGRDELARQLEQRLGGEVGEKLEELTEGAGIKLPDGVKLPDDTKKVLGGLLGGKNKGDG